jgi:aminoglycoside phosphotransferase (APT) family kinase protein
VYGWLDGDPVACLDDDGIAALADFVLTLRTLDTAGAPVPGLHNFGRGVPLARRDRAVRVALEASAGLVDVAAVTAVWERALAAAAWTGAPVWLHGDLRGDNLLGRAGRVSAVIDFGGLAVGDPACDLFCAWDVMQRPGRDLFRAAVDADEATWMRARGWALSIAIIALPYYLERQPNLATFARHVLGEVLADPQ